MQIANLGSPACSAEHNPIAKALHDANAARIAEVSHDGWALDEPETLKNTANSARAQHERKVLLIEPLDRTCYQLCKGE